MELHSSQWKDWRQWNQAAAMEIPMRYAEKILHGENDQALAQVAQGLWNLHPWSYSELD